MNTGDQVTVRARGDKWNGRTGTITAIKGEPKAQIVHVNIGGETVSFWDHELEATK